MGPTVQRFTHDDVVRRATEVWKKKGSPPHQTKPDEQQDWAEATRQLETEERAHGIWEDRGRPKNQSEDDGKKDYSAAELQMEMRRALHHLTDATLLTTELTRLHGAATTKGFGWPYVRLGFALLPDTVRALVHAGNPLRQLCMSFAATVADKAELLYYLKGTADWKQATMTANAITQEDFRQALVRLNVFETGTAGHKKAKEVDELIGEKLSAFVQTNFEARGRITGKVAVLGPADWDVIGRNQYGAVVWDGGKKNTLNAFVDRSSDPPRVFVNKDRGNAGTAIHEGCHMWGSAARPINAVSHNLNEGVTEYFARKICSSLTPAIPRTVYSKEYAIAKKLVDKIGEAKVGTAFFDGTLVSITAEFSPGKWTTFTDKIEADDYAAAAALLDGALK